MQFWRKQLWFGTVSLLFRPARQLWRAELLTWSRNARTKSANEVAQFINKEQFAERKGLASAGLKQNAKSY
jgi:hypothetical protein